MRITDFHTHAFPDDLARRAMTRLSEHADGKRAVLDGTVSDLLRSMDAAGVYRSVLCSVATVPKQFDPILAFSDRVRSDRIVPFPSFHPDSPDLAALVRRVGASGFLGVKLHPCYQGFAPDEDRFLPMYEA
ncbi:MAG: amidohydrolase family protein, partial [Planctomycetota bacterium]